MDTDEYGNPIQPRQKSAVPAYLTMADLDSQEKAMAQQAAVANQLRGSALQPSGRMDRGSQMARALQGLGAGVAMRQQRTALDKFSADKAGIMKKLYDY